MRKHRGAILAFASTFILIMFLYGINSTATDNIVHSGNVFTVNVDGSYLSDSMHIIGSISQSSDDNNYNYIRYDYRLYNDMDIPIKNWTALFDLEDGVIVKDYDGVFVHKVEKTDKENYYLVIPDYDIMDIDSKDSVSFSITLGSQEGNEFRLTSLSILGTCYEKNIFDIFNVLITILLALWGLLVFIYIYKNFNLKEYRRRQKMDEQIIIQAMDTFVRFVDAKDTYTRGHSKRVAMYAKEIATRMKLQEDEVQNIYYIGLLHDVGKISIPDTVLNKPGKLTDEERLIIQSHTVAGGNMLKNFTSIPGVREGALYHHERYDGTGYPEGLKGNDIPLYARIICIADSYDAMSSSRVYRRHLNRDEVIEELKRCTGTQFDPKIVEYMIDMIMDGYVNIVKNEVAKDDEDYKNNAI